jgi:hypothetical protein
MFSPVNILPPISMHILIYTLLLPEGQTVEAWELSKNNAFRKPGTLDAAVISLFIL